MRVLALLCVGLALVAARPDVSHLKKGYTYDKPATSYSTGSFNTPRFDSAQEFTSGSGNQATYVQPQQQSTGFSSQGQYVQPQTTGFVSQQYVQPQQQSTGFVSQGSYVQPQQTTGFASQSQGQYVQPQQQSTGFVSQGFSGQGQYQGGNQADTGFTTASRFSGNNYQQQQNLEPIVTKNFYVHAAPEERQVVQLRVIQEQARPRKNYNVIFVKTPAGPIFKAPHIQQQVQNEDKTLVYVLSKNQAHAEDIVIPAPAPAIPTKPEVFFIKYKNQHDADHKIQEIQSNYNQGNLNFNPQGLTSAQVDGPQLSSFTTTNTRFGDESSSGSGSGGNFVSQPAQSFQTVGSSNSGFGSGSSSGNFVSQPATSFQTVGLTDASFGSGSSSGGFSSGGSVGHGDSGSSSSGTSQTFTSGQSVGSDNEVEYLPANH